MSNSGGRVLALLMHMGRDLRVRGIEWNAHVRRHAWKSDEDDKKRCHCLSVAQEKENSVCKRSMESKRSDTAGKYAQ